MRAERPITRLLQWPQASVLVSQSRRWVQRGGSYGLQAQFCLLLLSFQTITPARRVLSDATRARCP